MGTEDSRIEVGEQSLAGGKRTQGKSKDPGETKVGMGTGENNVRTGVR